MISFKVHNRFTGALQFTAKIKAKASDDASIKLGLAVKWAHETGANLDGANLAGANLDGAYLARANLARANLAGANLAGANLAGANLAGAYLAGANLVGANLVGANLAGAYLDGAYLARANLARANLARANLVGANLASKTVKTLCGRATRNDGYEFFMWLFDDGSHVIKAGCRTFTADEFRAHVGRSYPNTLKAVETMAIIAFLEARLAAIADEIEDAQ